LSKIKGKEDKTYLMENLIDEIIIK